MRRRRHHGRHAPAPAVRRAWIMRWRLQRRIFLWFGAAILVSGAVVGTVVGVTGASGWRRDWSAMQDFAGKRFERVWDDAGERDALARSMHDDLKVDVIVRDPAGNRLASYGACSGPRVEIPVDRGRAHLGDVTLCSERHRGGFVRAAMSLFVALVVLWAGSHAIARRLTRPLVEIERVARAIARGDLTSRVDISSARGEEAHLLGSTLNEMADRIEKQIAEYRSLLAAVSHEIRTPLARMRLLIELLGAKDERAQELDREVVALDELVGELLAVSRVDFGALQKRRVEAKDVALRAIEDARVDPSVLALDDATASVEADPTLLVRALRNLLENAERHGGGVLSFRVARRDGEICFEVEDAGPGIPEGERDRIFLPFRKLGTDEKSVGLGLALVRRIALAHGGRTYARNRDPKGALVGIALAAAKSALVLLACFGCAHAPKAPPRPILATPHVASVAPASLPPPSADPDEQKGFATWYGARLAGHRTASGERFDPAKMTAAHRTLPLGTWVEVRRVGTSRTVRVRINDRGPFGYEDRIIDLSRAAFERLGSIREGVIPVVVRVVPGP